MLEKKIILIIDSVLKYEVSSQYLYCSKCHVKEHLRSWLERDIDVTDVFPGKEVWES